METRVGVGVVVRSTDGLVLVGGEARTFAALLVSGWVTAGVLVDIDLAAADAAPEVREPDKFGELGWIDPASLPHGLFPPTAALLELL